jgi:tetrahydromethanopterin S-methyltransferase subunit G
MKRLPSIGFGIVVGCLVLMIIQTIAHAFTM